MDEMYGLYQQTLSMAPSPPPAHDNYHHAFSFQDRSTSSTFFESGGHNYMLSSSSAMSSTNCTTTGSQLVGVGEKMSSEVRAKIVSHPLYPKLLHAYIECQKVGAPPDVANLFDEIFQEDNVSRRSSSSSSCLSDDPELNDFMESYCEVLMKYKSDLERPFNDATTFINNIETQLSTLCNGSTSRSNISEEVAGSSEEDLSSGEVEIQEPNQTGNDRQLKDNLMRKYSGYISSLKHEFSNKKKKGKLPKEARQTLLDWWNIHNKWPYPTEAEKVALAESTGLDQKQINNWFINQRKRHWKPSENMEFAIMDSLYGSFFMNN